MVLMNDQCSEVFAENDALLILPSDKHFTKRHSQFKAPKSEQPLTINVHRPIAGTRSPQHTICLQQVSSYTFSHIARSFQTNSPTWFCNFSFSQQCPLPETLLNSQTRLPISSA
jgi:hypothetical protein